MIYYYIIWPNEDSFNSTQNPLPSGQTLGEPRIDINGRRASCYGEDQLTQADLNYLTGIEGVVVQNTPPDPWIEPEQEEE